LGVGGALAVAASSPAQAQFMTGNYPVLIVPPPAQNPVVPKPSRFKGTVALAKNQPKLR
jgi:hypothetical protein